MSLLADAALKAVHSLPNGKLLRILLLSILLNALALGALIAGLLWLVHSTDWFGAWDAMTDIGFSLLAVAFAYFIFPVFLPLIISFFDTAIAEEVERSEYPGLQPMEPPFWPTLGHDIGFTLKALGLNLLCLPLYLLPGINLVVYFTLNGYLLGTEFFNIAAGRHLPYEQAQQLRRQHRMQTIGCGMLIAFCATLPLINLITPLWGVVLMVHYVNRLRGATPAPSTNR